MQSEKISYDPSNIIQHTATGPNKVIFHTPTTCIFIILNELLISYLYFKLKVDNGLTVGRETCADIKYYIGGSEAIPVDQREKNAIRARHLGAEMLGTFISIITICLLKKNIFIIQVKYKYNFDF